MCTSTIVVSVTSGVILQNASSDWFDRCSWAVDASHRCMEGISRPSPDSLLSSGRYVQTTHSPVNSRNSSAGLLQVQLSSSSWWGTLKKNDRGLLDQVGLSFFFSEVVMVTAAAGHFRTPSLARKNISRARFNTRAQNGNIRNTQKKAEGHRVECG